MSKLKRMIAILLFALGITMFTYAGDVTVTAITAQQRYPWNGKVDIAVTLSGASNDVAKAECTFAATNCATPAALATAHIAEAGMMSGSGTTWTRRFVWDATEDVGEVKIADVAFYVEAKALLGGVQLWENGPYWAECNVGATKPEEYGYYFWWGGTMGYERNPNYVGWVLHGTGERFSFSFGNCSTYRKNKSELELAGYIDSTGNLASARDAAMVYLGAPWRMPAEAEWSALINNCTTAWVTRNGVTGWLVTGKAAYALRSIFLPAAGLGYDYNLNDFGSYGYYWSSSPGSVSSECACYLYFYSGYSGLRSNYSPRYSGMSVRPLRGFANDVPSAATTHLALDMASGTRTAVARETIRYGATWETTASGATAEVSVNGVVVTNAIGSGTFEWTPTRNGILSFVTPTSLPCPTSGTHWKVRRRAIPTAARTCSGAS